MHIIVDARSRKRKNKFWRNKSEFHLRSLTENFWIIADGRSRKGKTSSGERGREVKSTHLCSTKVLLSLSTMDLEKEEIHSETESRQFNSLSIDESIPIKGGKADFCTSS